MDHSTQRAPKARSTVGRHRVLGTQNVGLIIRPFSSCFGEIDYQSSEREDHSIITVSQTAQFLPKMLGQYQKGIIGLSNNRRVPGSKYSKEP